MAGEEDWVALRADFLAAAASQQQSSVLASVDVSLLGEDALTVLLYDLLAETVELDEWDADIPLLVMATSYQPLTDVPAQSGDAVVFLDPSNESTFLDSLAKAGVAELFVRPDTVLRSPHSD